MTNWPTNLSKYLVLVCCTAFSGCSWEPNGIESINLCFSYYGTTGNSDSYYFGRQVLLKNLRTNNTDTLKVEKNGTISIANINDGPYLLVYENTFDEPMFRLIARGDVSNNDTINLQDNFIFRSGKDLWVDNLGDGDTLFFWGVNQEIPKAADYKKIILVKKDGTYFARFPLLGGRSIKGNKFRWVNIGKHLDLFVEFESEFRKISKLTFHCHHCSDTYFIANGIDTIQAETIPYKWDGLADLMITLDTLDFD